jgi:hypothetical protein
VPIDDPAKLRKALLVAAEQIQKQRVIIEAQNELLHWALGDGPLPCDEEAERALGYLFAAWCDDGADERLEPFFRRAERACVDGIPIVDLRAEAESMLPSEALRRVETAAELRRALGRIKLALRRAMNGDRGGTIRALRGAVDVFGETGASKAVELQWRVAELEAELRELQAVKGVLR